MVWMGFTCILYTNTFLVGHYWGFKALPYPIPVYIPLRQDTKDGFQQ